MHASNLFLLKLFNCDGFAGLSPSCFALDLIDDMSANKEAAPTEVDAHRRRVSLFRLPRDRLYASASNALTLNVTMRNLDADTSLFRYLVRLFPLRLQLISKEQLASRLRSTGVKLFNEGLSGVVFVRVCDHVLCFAELVNGRQPAQLPKNSTRNLCVSLSTSLVFAKLILLLTYVVFCV